MLSLQFPAQFACVQGFTSFTISLSLSIPCRGYLDPAGSHSATTSPFLALVHLDIDMCILYCILYYMQYTWVANLQLLVWSPRTGSLQRGLSWPPCLAAWLCLAVLGCAWLCLAVLGCAWLCSVSVESAYPEAQLPWCCFVARLITTGFLSGEVLATDPATDIANTQTH